MKTKLLLCAALLAGLYAASSGRDVETFYASEVRVIDGDTLEINGERYRLLGFDTPETFRAHCDEEFVLGSKATRRLKALLASTSTIRLQVEAKRDRYNRKLARAYVFDEDVANIMITEGLARAYGGGKRKPWCTVKERASREAALQHVFKRRTVN